MPDVESDYVSPAWTCSWRLEKEPTLESREREEKGERTTQVNEKLIHASLGSFIPLRQPTLLKLHKSDEKHHMDMLIWA